MEYISNHKPDGHEYKLAPTFKATIYGIFRQNPELLKIGNAYQIQQIMTDITPMRNPALTTDKAYRSDKNRKVFGLPALETTPRYGRYFRDENPQNVPFEYNIETCLGMLFVPAHVIDEQIFVPLD